MGLVGGLFFTSVQDKSSYLMFYAGCLSHKGCVRISVGFSSDCGVCGFFLSKKCNVFIVIEARGLNRRADKKNKY
jgi:hypothetical protein